MSPDDVGPAHCPSYGITSVTQPIMPMVEATVDILMDQIASGEIEPQHKVIAGELIVRTSARRHKKGIIERDGVKFYKPTGTKKDRAATWSDRRLASNCRDG